MIAAALAPASVAGFSECQTLDKTLRDCTVRVLDGVEVNTCSGEYREATTCNENALEDVEEMTGLEDCRGFYDAWEPFLTIDGCNYGSQTGLDCDNVPYSCGN